MAQEKPLTVKNFSCAIKKETSQSFFGCLPLLRCVQWTYLPFVDIMSFDLSFWWSVPHFLLILFSFTKYLHLMNRLTFPLESPP